MLEEQLFIGEFAGGKFGNSLDCSDLNWAAVGGINSQKLIEGNTCRNFLELVQIGVIEVVRIHGLDLRGSSEENLERIFG